jgi:hypothetical protein
MLSNVVRPILLSISHKCRRRTTKKGLGLPSKRPLPFSHGYKPEMDCTAELKPDGVQQFQEIAGSLHWAIELGQVDILLEMSLLSKHLALP